MSSSDNIKVFIRVRPLNKREVQDDPKPCISFDKAQPNYLIVDQKLPKVDPKVYNFDWIAGETSTQQEIFEAIGRPLAETYIQGYNCCIFAYGQTGAGKTYTMQGRGLEDDNEEEELVHRGLQPRIIDEIFALKEKEEAESPDVQFSIKCGYLEIYNEHITDLLNPSEKGLCVREDAKEGIYIENLMEFSIESSQQALEILRHGAYNRRTGSTNMNQESSRSHSLFIMTVQKKVKATITTSKFNFVDLAGSERQKMTNATGLLLKEAGNINKSLSVLGLVINNLVEAAEGKSRHIAYRESKLTYILKDSLGGNSKTCLIANISPAISSAPETISTLRFAQRAKLIKTKACINEAIDGDIEELKKELDRVKKELMYYKQLEHEKIPPVPREEPKEDYKSEAIEKSMQLLEQNKQLLVGEIEKKEQFCQKMKDIYSFYAIKETQFSSLCEVKESKIQRLKGNLSANVKSIDSGATLQAENTELRKENKLLIEVIKSTPLIMQATSSRDDRAARRSEAKDGASSSSSPQTKILLDKNLSYLQQLIQKLNNNLPTERMEIEEDIKQNQTLVTELTTQLTKQKEQEVEQIKRLTDAEKKSEELLIELVQEKQKFAQELQEKLNYIQELEAHRDNNIQIPEPIMTESQFTKEEKIKRLQEALEIRSQATNDLENLVTKLSHQVLALSENVTRVQQAEVQQPSQRMTWEEIEKIKMNNVSLKSTIQELKRQKKIKSQRIQRQEALIRVLESDKRAGPKLDELIRPLKDMSEQLYSRFEEMNMDATLIFAENEKYKAETKQLVFEKEKLQDEKKSLLETIEELTKAKEESDRNIKRLRDEKLAMMVDLIREAKSSIDHEGHQDPEIPLFSSDNKENEVEPKATVEKKASCCQKGHLVGADGMGPKSTVKSSQGKRNFEELESAKKSKKKTMIGGTNSAFKKFKSASKMRGGSNEEPIILDDGDDVNIFEEPLIKKIKREHLI